MMTAEDARKRAKIDPPSVNERARQLANYVDRMIYSRSEDGHDHLVTTGPLNEFLTLTTNTSQKVTSDRKEVQIVLDELRDGGYDLVIERTPIGQGKTITRLKISWKD